ncbi:Transcription factor spt20, partial [Dipsacomyces acuminosporus]
MRPTSETINLDLHLACERNRSTLSQDDILRIEGMILLAVEEPLDLEPDVQVSRVSNAIRYIEYGHLLPRKNRKYNSAEIEAEQAEREEKLKLLTLMDDRKNRDFQPSFNRVSQINEWRHKKLLGDAEVYPAAVPPVVSTGKKAPSKKSRSQMSLLADGRKVIRTLRFVKTVNGRSIHTVFHVVELPDNHGLQGILRWGTLPDSSLDGDTRIFPFANELMMRTHIDNFKLFSSMEDNRLIYDSLYPNGVPTSGPPPSAAAPSLVSNSGNGYNSNSAPIASVAGSTTANSSPAVGSASQSPVVTAGSIEKTEAAKSKASSTKVNARGSRKNSPQPKPKKSNARGSAEPDMDDESETKSTK